MVVFSFSTLPCTLALGAFAYALPSQPLSTFHDDLFRRQNSLSDCLAAAGITASLPTTSTWASDTLAWCSRVSPVPSAVVFPKTEEEVSAALKCAAASATKVTTLGGNRSFHSAGFGRNDGALIVNLVNMKVLQYDESTELLTYGGPVMISEAADYMWTNFQRAMPHGRCPDVGMTGVAASGFGTLSRASGTVLDNIVSVRVALADGSIVNASTDENDDLFWAQQNVDALLGTQAWAQSADNDDLLSIRFGLRSSAQLTGFYYGTPEQFDAVAAKLLSYLPANMTVSAGSSEFWASEDLTTPGLVAQSITPRRYFYIASITVPESKPLDNSTAWSLFSSTVYAPKLTDATASGFVDIWGGAYTASVPADLSAWKHDGNLLLVRWDMRTTSGDVAFSAASLQTMRTGFYSFVDAYKASGGVPGGFTTYRDAEWTLEESAEYLYGMEGYKVLQKIKTKYDAGMLFNTDPQAISALAS